MTLDDRNAPKRNIVSTLRSAYGMSRPSVVCPSSVTLLHRHYAKT